MADLYSLPAAGPGDAATRLPSSGVDGRTAAGGRARRLSEGEYTSAVTVAALVAVLGLLGFVNSFTAVMAAAEPSFGRLAFSVPLGIDLGIAIFAALDIVLARLDMRARWLRLIPWTLTAATVYLNVASEHTVFGRIAHAVLPCLWVAAVEVGAHVVKVRAGIEAGTRMESIRPSRWVLAPWPTLKLWRRMVLWEIRSYPDALTRERARLLALTELQDTYGRWGWRRRAPRRVRALYRLGELTSAAPAAEMNTAPSEGLSGGPVGDRPALESGPSAGPSSPRTRTAPAPSTTRTATRTGGRSTRSSRTRKATKPAPPDVEDLMPLGWGIVADLDRAGEPLTRNALAARLREAGQSAGNARVGALLARLKTETPPTDPTAPTTTAPSSSTPAAAPVNEGDDAS
jgi:Protein of unknown function (DUF2637)